jgi:hypothetical protein
VVESSNTLLNSSVVPLRVRLVLLSVSQVERHQLALILKGNNRTPEFLVSMCSHNGEAPILVKTKDVLKRTPIVYRGSLNYAASCAKHNSIADGG